MCEAVAVGQWEMNQASGRAVTPMKRSPQAPAGANGAGRASGQIEQDEGEAEGSERGDGDQYREWSLKGCCCGRDRFGG